MQLLEDVLFSIVKYRVTKLQNSYLILNHALYLKKVELHLGSNMLRLKNTLHGCLFAKENMSSMSKRQAYVHQFSADDGWISLIYVTCE
jgi:hypothetical protein